MAIANQYARSVHDFNEDFKIDEEKLQTIVDKYERSLPRVIKRLSLISIEGIEKNEIFKLFVAEYSENLKK